MQNVHYFREVNFLSERKRRWRTTSGLPLSPWQESAAGAVAQIIRPVISSLVYRLGFVLHFTFVIVLHDKPLSITLTWI
jgi:hypothetical protein